MRQGGSLQLGLGLSRALIPGCVLDLPQSSPWLPFLVQEVQQPSGGQRITEVHGLYSALSAQDAPRSLAEL